MRSGAPPGAEEAGDPQRLLTVSVAANRRAPQARESGSPRGITGRERGAGDDLQQSRRLAAAARDRRNHWVVSIAPGRRNDHIDLVQPSRGQSGPQDLGVHATDRHSNAISGWVGAGEYHSRGRARIGGTKSRAEQEPAHRRGHGKPWW